MKRILAPLLALVMLFTASACGTRTVPMPTLKPYASAAITIAPTAEQTPSAQPTEEPTPTAEPTPEPTPEPDPTEVRAREILEAMSLHEKICQMMIVYPEDVAGVERVSISGPLMESGLKSWPVGGLVYAAKNLEDSQQVKDMTSGAQERSALGLFICVDEEGGRVGRLMNNIGTTKLDAMFTYRDQGTDTAYSNALTIGRDIAAHGFNVDFAPVADVWSNPENTAIGDRAYSDDFEQAAELVASAVKGFTDAGVISSLKHFPGHGDTSEDSHFGGAYTDKTLEELRTQEFLPFVAGIDAGAEMVMVSHVTVSSVTDVPATVSGEIITDILRGELGFDGVVITDSLAMAALTGKYSTSEIVKMCVDAGVDILLGPGSLSSAVSALKAAVSSGEISRERIDESVMRILLLKLRHGIIE